MTKTDTKKRPKLVWAITILYFISLVFTAYSQYAVYTGLIELPADAKAYYDNLGIIDYGIMFISGIIGIAAVATLFMLKKITTTLWAIYLGVSVLTQVYSAVSTPEYLKTVERSGMVGIIIGVVIMAAIYLYTRRLDARGYLV